VDLRATEGANFLQARLNVSVPGTDAELARTLVEEAHQACLYSKPTDGNIGVELNLV
jgi:organic hydroperoxide reductase OsmC/OhrA